MISEEDGLTQIVLQNFKQSCGPFDESLLDRFAKSSIRLKTLEVTSMIFLSTESRQQLTNLVVKIIQTNLLSHLNLEAFSLNYDGEQGEQILEALCASNIKLVYLNMTENKGWWIQEGCIQLLQAFLREQERLEELHLRHSYFSSEFSEKLLTTIAQTSRLS